MKIVESKKGKVAIATKYEVMIHNTRDALDLMATIGYEGCDNIILNKENFIEAFFDLSTKIAGDILQKYANYNMKLAIVGDFSKYTSKSLKDFMYECNCGRHVFFVSSQEEARMLMGI